MPKAASWHGLVGDPLAVDAVDPGVDAGTRGIARVLQGPDVRDGAHAARVAA
jgi:hypothetical protein